MSKKIITGTNYYHTEMRMTATKALQKIAGYIPKKAPIDDFAPMTFDVSKTSRWYIHQSKYSVVYQVIFIANICARCADGLNRMHAGKSALLQVWFRSVYADEICELCGDNCEDKIPF